MTPFPLHAFGGEHWAKGGRDTFFFPPSPSFLFVRTSHFPPTAPCSAATLGFNQRKDWRYFAPPPPPSRFPPFLKCPPVELLVVFRGSHCSSRKRRAGRSLFPSISPRCRLEAAPIFMFDVGSMDNRGLFELGLALFSSLLSRALPFLGSDELSKRIRCAVEENS